MIGAAMVWTLAAYLVAIATFAPVGAVMAMRDDTRPLSGRLAFAGLCLATGAAAAFVVAHVGPAFLEMML